MRVFKRCIVAATVFLIVVNPLLASPDSPTAKPREAAAKNIIIMISDGWGFNHVEAASYYRYGKDARQIFNRFPFTYAMSTPMAYRTAADPCHGHGYDPQAAWSDFGYVESCSTDSAAAATAISTGVKTYGGAIGVDLDRQPLVHALEIAGPGLESA